MSTQTRTNFTSVPPEIKRRKQWICWKREQREERDGQVKLTKIPYSTDCIGGASNTNYARASTTDLATWGTFEAACNVFNRGYFDGIGFVFSLDDPFFGVDLDKCRDPETGKLEDWAQTIVRELNSYTEITPSETGLHVIGEGKIPLGGNRNGRLEMYDHGRYFTVTGEHLEGTPTSIEERQEELATLHSRIFPKAVIPETRNHSGSNGIYHVEKTDDELLKKATAAKNGEAFTKLWQGDVSAYGGDDSAADLALCCLLSFWTRNDPARIDRLFRQSGLYREKWERKNYRDRTISKAIESNGETYNPSGSGNGKGEGATTNIREDATFKKTTNPNQETLPEIKVGNRQLRDITSDGLTALELANEPVPSLFRFGSGLARISHKDDQSAFLEPVTEPVIRYLLSTSATFKKYNKEGNSFDCLPPLDMARNILVASEEWRFPKLSGLVEVPVLRPDFSVLSSPGYDTATGLYLETQQGLEIPDIPDKPTDSELQDAVAMISEPFADFYFVDPASRANMIGALLLPIIRQAINGPVPLVAINKSQPGCGGSLLTDIIAIIASGRPAYMAQAAREDEEWRKLLTSILLAGHSFVVFDNIDRIIESADLASFVTALIWQDRLLGQSTTVQLPNSTVCFLNGNNIKVGGNLARRLVPVGLDAPDCRPWLRDPSAFKHPDLRRWALDNRGVIISSILTVVRAWVVAGQPKAKNPVSLGSFESYSHIVGDILSFMGINGFLANLNRLYDEMDVDTPMWANFFELWHSEIGDTPLTVVGLVARLGDIPDLKAALPDTVSDVDRPNYTRRLGKQLAKRERQKFPGGLTLVKAGDKKRSVLWRVVSYENANSPIFTNKSEFGEFTSPLIVETSGCENNKYKGAVQNSPKLTAEAKSGELCPTNSPTDPVPVSLGMSDEDALTIWRKHGAPMVHLGRTQNCLNLEQQLSKPDIPDWQLQAIKKWLDEHKGD